MSFLGDTKSTIPATRRLVSNFWVVHSTKYQVRKRFDGKAFESVIEMGNLYSVVVKNVVAETNDFFQAFSLLLANDRARVDANIKSVNEIYRR